MVSFHLKVGGATDLKTNKTNSELVKFVLYITTKMLLVFRKYLRMSCSRMLRKQRGKKSKRIVGGKSQGFLLSR